MAQSARKALFVELVEECVLSLVGSFSTGFVYSMHSSNARASMASGTQSDSPSMIVTCHGNSRDFEGRMCTRNPLCASHSTALTSILSLHPVILILSFKLLASS